MAYAGFEAPRTVGPMEGVNAELVQKRGHRNMRVGRDRVLQRQRPVRGQLSHEPIGQGADGIILFLLGSLLCASAWNMAALIAFRVVQGLGGGALQGTVQTIAGPDAKLMLVRTNSVSGKTSIFHSPAPADAEAGL